MRIGFYAPLKAPDHHVPSGDRQMARSLIKALELGGHEVELISRLRSFRAEPCIEALADLHAEAAVERARLATVWSKSGKPDLLFAYHPFYKAPDLVARPLAETLALPYVTAEASHAPKRASGPWAECHREAERAICQAAINICFTARDRAGLAKLVPTARLADLPPFIDVAGYPAPIVSQGTKEGPIRLITVAMMRAGDKERSYEFLAAALGRLGKVDWHLTVVGDGPARDAIEAAFSSLPSSRLSWRGTLQTAGVLEALVRSYLFVWPGFNEAYGLCYLEAQACGLPVVAVDNAGTPSVIQAGETGLLTAPDVDAFAAAIAALATSPERRWALGDAASRFVRTERTLPVAALRLNESLKSAMSLSA